MSLNNKTIDIKISLNYFLFLLSLSAIMILSFLVYIHNQINKANELIAFLKSDTVKLKKLVETTLKTNDELLKSLKKIEAKNNELLNLIEKLTNSNETLQQQYDSLVFQNQTFLGNVMSDPNSWKIVLGISAIVITTGFVWYGAFSFINMHNNSFVGILLNGINTKIKSGLALCGFTNKTVNSYTFTDNNAVDYIVKIIDNNGKISCDGIQISMDGTTFLLSEYISDLISLAQKPDSVSVLSSSSSSSSASDAAVNAIVNTGLNLDSLAATTDTVTAILSGGGAT